MTTNRKGIDALELVFSMFILIIVTLVLIRLFTSTVAPGKLPDTASFAQSYNYQQEINKCNTFCDSFKQNGCTSTADAVSFCQQQVSLDIDGDYKAGEIGHGGFVNHVPYCEDGLYCFHIVQNCGCGSYILSPSTCLQLMKDYYEGTLGLTQKQTYNIILKSIYPGTCNPDTSTWPQTYNRELPGSADTSLRADWWYCNAGYQNLGDNPNAPYPLCPGS